MDNKELMNKLQILANQYQKLEKENEGLKNQLEEERNNAEHLQACIKETVRIVNDTKESTIQANETIEEMKNQLFRNNKDQNIKQTSGFIYYSIM